MTRFEDTLRRDLHVIADRATPSPDAWASIRQRIADREPAQETEIIMLTDNTMPTRRWPLVAAAAAVAALAIGAVIGFGTGGDDDQIPAEPAPSVQPAPDDTAPAVGPRTIAATGRSTAVSEFSPLDADGTGAYVGTSTFEGDLTATASETGRYAPSDDGAESSGTAAMTLDGSIDGVGSGTLTLDVVWSSSTTSPIDWRGTIVAGTGDFAGATGTLTLTSGGYIDDPDTATIEMAGSYSLDLVLGAEPDGTDSATPGDPPEEAVDDGSTTDEPAAARPDAQLLSLSLTGTTIGTIGTNGVTDGDGGVLRGTETWTGGADLAGLKEGTYSQQGNDLSGDLLLYLDGSVDGVGRGELTLAATIELVDGTTDDGGQIDGGTLVVVGEIVEGTGALVGATGTFEQRGTFPLLSGSYTLELAVPAPDGARISHATGTWGDKNYRIGDPIDDDGPERLATTFTRTWRGEVDGESPAIGFVVSRERGGATLEFTGTVAGIGAGTLTIEETYVTDPGLRGVAVIVDGTGDLAGARGTLRFDGGMTYVMDIEAPAAPIIDRPRIVTRVATTQTTRVDSARAGTGTDYTAEVTYEGAVSGTAAAIGRFERDEQLQTTGWSDAVFTGSVDGIGSGTLTVREIWRSSESGRLVSMAVVLGGTDDFADAAGWIRTVSEDDGRTGETTIELRLPDAG